MQPSTLSEIQQKAIALGSAEQPFVVKAEGNKIIGSWNILDAKWLGLISANNADKNYSIAFELDEATHEFSYREQYSESDSTVGMKPGGVFSFGKSFGGSTGKQFGTKKAGITIGLGMKNKDEPTQPIGAASYNFDVNKIKAPIIGLLTQSGWSEKKKGLLGRLFK